jgi:hypothetical protein
VHIFEDGRRDDTLSPVKRPKTRRERGMKKLTIEELRVRIMAELEQEVTRVGCGN